jgi:hypothetical protein
MRVYGAELRQVEPPSLPPPEWRSLYRPGDVVTSTGAAGSDAARYRLIEWYGPSRRWANEWRNPTTWWVASRVGGARRVLVGVGASGELVQVRAM